MLETLEKIGIIGTYLNIVKAIYAKPRELILMNLTNRVDIEEWSLMGQYGQIHPDDSILTNIQQSVDIDESISTGWYWWICTENSILKDLPWWVNINESTFTN